MKKQMKRDGVSPREIGDFFDQTIAKHLERLMGTRYAIGGLSLNLATISCLILLTEQVTNELADFATPSDRYTPETLVDELAEMGFTIREDLDLALKGMVEKGYVDFDQDRRFSANKPTITMAHLLERIFPKMPGMSLVAYITQTVEEVQSGRKPLETGISQLDQMLRMQGVALLEDRSETKREKTRKPPMVRNSRPGIFETTISPPQIKKDGGFKLSDFYIPPKTKEQADKSRIPISEPQTPSSDGGSTGPDAEAIKIDDTLSTQDESTIETGEVELQQTQEEEIRETKEVPPGEEAKGEIDAESETTKADLIPEDSAEPPPQTVDAPPGSKIEEQEIDFFKDSESDWESPLGAVETESQAESVSEEPFPVGADKEGDETVESRIASFQEDLASQCPICKSARIHKEETAAGKSYYRCTDRGCSFISWGKPYHSACPECDNPFLVEITTKDNRPILKCPRATCRYWREPSAKGNVEPLEKPVLPPQETTQGAVTKKKLRRKVIRKKVYRRRR